jgi:membrane-bound serine protease (ClpP class)
MPTFLAIALILIGIGFVAVEVYAPGFGGPGTAAVVCFVVAAMLLIDDRTSVRVPEHIIVGAGIAGIVMIGIVTAIAVRIRKVPPQAPSLVLGEVGVAISDLDPVGTVRVRAEEWTATSESGAIPAGAQVKVVGERGLQLRVDRLAGGSGVSPDKEG